MAEVKEVVVAVVFPVTQTQRTVLQTRGHGLLEEVSYGCSGILME